MSEEIAERVALGAAWLDANVPDWRSRMDLSTFDIESPCRCVFGQVFAAEAEEDTGAHSGFEYAVGAWDDNAFFTPDEAVAHGFDYYESAEEYAELQAEWEAVIAKPVL